MPHDSDRGGGSSSNPNPKPDRPPLAASLAAPASRFLRVDRKGHPWRAVTEDWLYAWESGGTLLRLRVFAGTEWNGASVPRLAWTFLGLLPNGELETASLPHDLLYRFQGRNAAMWASGQAVLEYWDDDAAAWLLVARDWTREEADRLFGRICRECGVNERDRRRAYEAVRKYGALYWNDTRTPA